MRKFLNKTVSALCTLAMCLSLVPCVGYADVVETTDDFVIDEIERVYDIDFTTGENRYSEEKTNFVLRGTTDGFNEATGEGYKQPAFFKYDISSIADKNIVGAYLVWGNGNSSQFSLYDVPGNDLTLTYDENGKVSERIKLGDKIDTRKKAGSLENLSDFPLMAENGNYNKYNFYFDVTEKVKQRILNNIDYFTVNISVIYNSTAYMERAGAKLYVKTTDKPVVNIDAPTEIYSNETLDITANITDSNSIKSAELLIDGTAVENAAFDSAAKTVSASVSGLSAGSHTVTVNAVDYWGVTGTASMQINVEMYIASEMSSIVPAVTIENPNFRDNLDYSGATYQNGALDKSNYVMISNRPSPGNLNASTIKAPILMKFDVSEYLDPDNDNVNEYEIAEAYILTKTVSQTGTPMNFYGVVKNDVSLDSMRTGKDDEGNPKLEVPELTETYVTANYDNKYGDAAASFTALKAAGKFDSISSGSLGNMGAAFDLTDYAGKCGGSFSVMMTSRYDPTLYIGNRDTDNKPRLYVRLVKKLVIDNGDSVAITVNPSVYTDSGSVVVITAMYNGDMLISADAKTVDTPDNYTDYTVSKAEGTTKTKVFIFDGLSADKAPTPLLKTPWQSN